ncbi:amidohydrolase family protein [Parvularcula maris]|uniref:Amidohydrolase family protein n=1 Tax=Parvularcula maris TaxID=2965077 RepID=A0A9X2L8N1_9PROT|nr:amidohydrolase family protein [Parvularcula maris]MCQ8185135.1 amidohydrolase family protein [Parvularcula maris]
MNGIARYGPALLVLLTACVPGSPPDSEFDTASIAFESVRVRTMTEAGVIEDGHVIVDDGRIVTVGEGPAPDAFDGLRIDGDGATLMPGLADMHVHYYEDGAGVLYLANSTTSVRNLTGSTAAVARGRLATAGALLGPRVFTSGPIIDGGESFPNDFFTRVYSPEQAVGAVKAQGGAGFDAIKLYDHLSPVTYRAAVETAKAEGLRVYTHVPDEMTFAEVLALEVDSVEHLDGVAEMVARDGFAAETGSRAEIWAQADPAKFADVAAMTAASGVWQVPTFAITHGRIRSADPDAYFAAPEAAYLPAWASYWRNSAEGYAKDRPYFEAQLREKIAFVSALREAGANVLVGTDAPNPFVTPGFSIHEEMQTLVMAGYSNEEVLTLATVEAARFLGREGQIGIVAEGAVADLVLLPGDPADDLTSLRKPLGVMVSGHWYTAAHLAEGLRRRAEAMKPESDR